MTTLKRNPEAVLNSLYENQAGQILTKVNCRIQVPVRFSSIGLGQIGINTFTYGFFPIILESGEYSILSINSLVELNPTKLTISTIDEVDYHNFQFDANTVMIKTTDLVKRDNLIFNIIDEFIFKGKIPWYVEYEDLGKMLDNSNYYAGSNVNKNYEIIEFIASLITRSKDDRTKKIRNIVKSYSDISRNTIDYVPLKSIFYSVETTTNKLAGSYFSDGVISALVNKSEKVDKIESILRA